MDNKNIEKRLRKTIIILVVLLLVLVFLTIYTVGSFKIVKSGRNVVYAEDEDIHINSVSPSGNETIRIDNFVPGDSLTKEYVVNISYYSSIDLMFGVVKSQGSEYDLSDNPISDTVNFKVSVDKGSGYEEVFDNTMNYLNSNHIKTELSSMSKTTDNIKYKIEVYMPTSIADNYSDVSDRDVQEKSIMFDMFWYVGDPPEKPSEPTPRPGYLIPTTGVIGSLYIVCKDYGWLLLLILVLIVAICFVYRKRNRNENGK